MKKIVIAFVVLAGVSAQASSGDKSNGCGLGWQVAPQTSLISSYTRSITNASTSSTSGMTSGTSGCDKHSIVDNNKLDIHYAEVNFHSLMVEMAQGHGEYLSGFAVVMGCSDKNIAVFSKMTQKHYRELMPSQNASPDGLLENVKRTMKQEGVCQGSLS